MATHSAWCPALGPRVELPLLDAAILAWLALEGPTARERLAQWLWPHSSPEAGRNALRQRLFRLKKLAGRDVVVGTTTASLAADLWHDLHDGGPLLGDQTAHDSPALAQWLEARRARHQAQTRQLDEARIEALEAAGDIAAALPLALALVAQAPLSEDAHRRVMRLHYLRGDRAAAMLAFDHCEQLLKHEVGTQPSAATLALLHTIERGAVPVAAPPPWHGAVPAAVLRPPRLIGRDTELAALQRAWRAGSVVLVSGEAGMGKSRLLEALAAPSPRVLGVAARPGDPLVPYASLARLLREVVTHVPQALNPDLQIALQALLPGSSHQPPLPLPAPPPPGARRVALVEPVRQLLENAGPHLDGLVFDDVHFADEASTELLQALLTAPRQASPLRWCLGLRPPVPGSAQHRLCEAVQSAAPLVHLPLRPLDVGPMAELINALGLEGVDGQRLAPALRQRSGGNPLFALETLKLAWTDGTLAQPGVAGEALPRPDSLAQLIARQLGRLSAQATMLTRIAAIAGTDFSLPLAEKVSGQRALQLADAWQELEAQQVLQGTAFAHDLVCEAVLAGLPHVIARHLHGEVAAWLEHHGGEAAQVAAHWEAAGQPAKALPHLQVAAERAHRALRERERIGFLLRAADIAEAVGDLAQAFDRVASAVETHMNAIREASGFPLLDRLDALARTPLQQARALGQRAWYCGQLDDHGPAVQHGEAALRLAQAVGEPTLTAQVQQRLGTCLALSGRFDQALPHLEAAEAWVKSHLDEEDRAEFHGNFAVTLDNLGNAQAAQVQHRLAALALQGTADHAQRATHHANHAVNRLNAGDVAGARQLLNTARTLVDDYDQHGSSAAFVWFLLTQCARAEGRYTEALACADRAEHLLQTSNPARLPVVALQRAHCWLDLGQHARALQTLAGLAGKLPHHINPRRFLLEAQLLRATGQAAAATAALAAAADALPNSGWPGTRLLVQLEQALANAPQAGLGPLEAVHSEALQRGLQGTALTALLQGTACAAAQGLLPVAKIRQRARVALLQARQVEPSLLDHASPWLLTGQALQAIGDPARPAFVEGRAWLLHTAASQVPPEFKTSFLDQHPAHRTLLALGA